MRSINDSVLGQKWKHRESMALRKVNLICSMFGTDKLENPKRSSNCVMAHQIKHPQYQQVILCKNHIIIVSNSKWKNMYSYFITTTSKSIGKHANDN